MAIFNKKEEEKKDAKKPVAKKKATKKDAPVKEKKASKPKSDAGANLTKAPGRIIKAPVITEKAVKMTMDNAYVFEEMQQKMT